MIPGFVFRSLEIMFIPWPCATSMVMGKERYVGEGKLLCVQLNKSSRDSDLGVGRSVSFSWLLRGPCCLNELAGLVCPSTLS